MQAFEKPMRNALRRKTMRINAKTMKNNQPGRRKPALNLFNFLALFCATAALSSQTLFGLRWRGRRRTTVIVGKAALI
jgi:hypothetical protein